MTLLLVPATECRRWSTRLSTFTPSLGALDVHPFARVEGYVLTGTVTPPAGPSKAPALVIAKDRPRPLRDAELPQGSINPALIAYRGSYGFRPSARARTIEARGIVSIEIVLNDTVRNVTNDNVGDHGRI